MLGIRCSAIPLTLGWESLTNGVKNELFKSNVDNLNSAIRRQNWQNKEQQQKHHETTCLICTFIR